MKKIIAFFTIIFLATLLFLAPPQISAADKLVFDSTDNYLGACQLTNKSEWTLLEDIEVSTFQIWYSWNQDETVLPVKVYKDNTLFAEFDAIRSSCDTYQKQWCNADYAINKTFPKGTYSTLIPNIRQCLEPGGTGAVRLYVNDVETAVAESSPTNYPTEMIANNATPTTYTQNTKSADCSCNQTTTIAIAAGISSIISLLISFLAKKIK